MRVYSYIVRYDFGFAPNPFHGWCTLATCKQDLRAHASTGDWIIGTGSKSRGRDDRLVYAMEVEEILSFEEYWADPRFTHKKPNLSGSLKQQYGDNIYHRNEKGNWVQSDSRHSFDGGKPNQGHVDRDTKANRVLVSRKFVYFGGDGPKIPEHLRDWDGVDLCHRTQAYRCKFPSEMRDEIIRWIDELDSGYMGDPLDWGG